MALEASRSGLADVIDRILDKGLVINADITVSVVGVELLGIKIRAALASFETAAQYGLELPSGTNLTAPAWNSLLVMNSTGCPQCDARVPEATLSGSGCPLCGWVGERSEMIQQEIR